MCCEPESQLQNDHDFDVEFEISEEFLDSITFTITADPILWAQVGNLFCGLRLVIYSVDSGW